MVLGLQRRSWLNGHCIQGVLTMAHMALETPDLEVFAHAFEPAAREKIEENGGRRRIFPKAPPSLTFNYQNHHCCSLPISSIHGFITRAFLHDGFSSQWYSIYIGPKVTSFHPDLAIYQRLHAALRRLHRRRSCKHFKAHATTTTWSLWVCESGPFFGATVMDF